MIGRICVRRDYSPPNISFQLIPFSDQSSASCCLSRLIYLTCIGWYGRCLKSNLILVPILWLAHHSHTTQSLQTNGPRSPRKSWDGDEGWGDGWWKNVGGCVERRRLWPTADDLPLMWARGNKFVKPGEGESLPRWRVYMCFNPNQNNRQSHEHKLLSTRGNCLQGKGSCIVVKREDVKYSL